LKKNPNYVNHTSCDTRQNHNIVLILPRKTPSPNKNETKEKDPFHQTPQTVLLGIKDVKKNKINL
jgi:hypothetical protein